MKKKLKRLSGIAAIMLLVVMVWVYFFKERKYTPDLYKEIVQATKDDMYATAGWYNKRMNKEDFHKLVRDLVSNKELDLRALRIGINYSAQYGYCDYIEQIEEQIRKVENSIGTEWTVKVNDWVTKRYEFSNRSEWKKYKETFITPQLKELTANCSQ